MTMRSKGGVVSKCGHLRKKIKDDENYKKGDRANAAILEARAKTTSSTSRVSEYAAILIQRAKTTGSTGRGSEQMRPKYLLRNIKMNIFWTYKNEYRPYWCNL
jgi:hypothetical protein